MNNKTQASQIDNLAKNFSLLPVDEFLLGVARLKAKTSGTTLPKDRLLKQLTIQPPWSLVMHLVNILRHHPEILMLSKFVQDALARAHYPQFQLYGGYIIFREVAWDADEVRAHFTFCFGESADDVPHAPWMRWVKTANPKAHISVLHQTPLDSEPSHSRLLRGQATVGFRPEGEMWAEVNDVNLTGGQ